MVGRTGVTRREFGGAEIKSCRLHDRRRSLWQGSNDTSTGEASTTPHCAGAIIPTARVLRVATIGIGVSTVVHLRRGMIPMLMLVFFHGAGIGQQWLSCNCKGKENSQDF